MVKVALTGGAYQAHSVIASAQRSLNLFSEPIPTGNQYQGTTGQGEPSSAAHYPTPGLRLLGTIGAGPIRGIRQCTTGGVYVVSGDTLYSVDTSNWSGTPLGTLTLGLKTPVSMSDNGLDMLVVDGTANGWDVTLASNTFSQITNVIAATHGTLQSGAFTAPQQATLLTTLQAITDGSFSITIDGNPFTVPQVDFSGIGTLTDAATLLTGSGSVGSVAWNGTTGVFTLTSGLTGSSSTLSYASAPPTGTDISATLKLTAASGASAPVNGVDALTFNGADRVDYLDTYFLFNKPNTPQFYISGSLAVTFDSLDFANKESYSDLLVTIVVAGRLVYLLGEKTTEVWYNAGATDIGAGSFPFAALQSYVIVDHGCAAKYSPAVLESSVFWLCKNRQGKGYVMRVTETKATRISTYAIEAELAGYERISDAIGFCYQLAGHAFYVLTFPTADKTWCYEPATGHWHEWAWIDSNGAEHRHRANCFWPVNDTLVVGDWQNGNLYALDNRVFTDAGQPIKRVRTWPHMLNDGKRVFYRQFLADLETGWAPEAILSGTETRLAATFTAPDGTNLSAYTSEVGGGWTAIGPAAAQIAGDKVVGLGGNALYQSAATILTSDYTLHFDVVPPVAGSVVSATTVWAIGRASGANTGYRAAVSADGTQYTLSLAVLPSGASASVVMGTIASGLYTVWLLLRGSNITAQVQRSIDMLWLRTDGTWHTDPGTTAATLADTTYTTPGVIMLGGTWPTPPPPPALQVTYETPMGSDPNFPTGYSNQANRQAFDFTRNWFYQAITGSGNGGIAVTDLTSMTVTKTATLAQMYAGTPYGYPAGSPPSQIVFDITSGNGTDLYLLMDKGVGGGLPGEFCRFTRVDPVTMKVTGEFYSSASFPPPITCVMPNDPGSAVNTTTSHTIVAYRTNSSTLGPQILDGTAMAPIGIGASPFYGVAQSLIVPGAKRSDGSCDFLMLDPDNTTTGNIRIWRINVSNSLVITSTHTGTANILSLFSPTPNLYVAQADYDAAHDTIILQLTNSGTSTGPPIWVVSVNYNGTINWSQGPISIIGIANSQGKSLLTGTTLMVGDGSNLQLINTGTGAMASPGSAPTVSGSYYRVYDASRQSYWTFSLSLSFGFTRITVPIVSPPMLAVDNLLATATATLLEQNLISLRWSDDRGHVYGSPVTQDIGEAGEYRTSLQWQRLGMARDRVFEISWSVPMKTALQGAWIDVTPAQS